MKLKHMELKRFLLATKRIRNWRKKHNRTRREFLLLHIICVQRMKGLRMKYRVERDVNVGPYSERCTLEVGEGQWDLICIFVLCPTFSLLSSLEFETQWVLINDTSPLLGCKFYCMQMYANVHPEERRGVVNEHSLSLNFQSTLVLNVKFRALNCCGELR